MRLDESAAWQKLKEHYQKNKNIQLQELFDRDGNRFQKFSLEAAGLLVDFSKNLVDEETIALLLDLACQQDLGTWTDDMLAGKPINRTENRAVLHTALRNRSNTPVMVEGQDVMPVVKKVLGHMRFFTESVQNGNWRGYTGREITDVVNIGIGGSDLGPKMVTEALKFFRNKRISSHFVSNVDGTHITETLRRLNPETTLFIIASKTFTTQETMTNANTARQWFLGQGGKKQDIAKHFVAVSTNIQEVTRFGIASENMFEFWDWVGGRYSLWSAIGLSIATSIGFQRFEELLAGAHEMDTHFTTAKLEENIPVILALLGIWYNNFHKAQTYAVIPYDQYLVHLPAYLQQLDMESNGKYIDHSNQPVTYSTGPIIWGDAGTNGQHAFFQLLHQGNKLVPVDFLAPANSSNKIGDHHLKLLANFLAQPQALMMGKDEEQVKAELLDAGLPEEKIAWLAPHKIFLGNRPSTSIMFKSLNPRTLGAIISMYEHKFFVVGIIWEIYSFDQWGVELGKQLAKKILPQLKEDKEVNDHDSSTNGLINYIVSARKFAS